MSLIRGNFIVILMLVFSGMILPSLRWFAFLWLLLLFIADLLLNKKIVSPHLTSHIFLWVLLLILSDLLLINGMIPSHLMSEIFLWLFLFIIVDLIFVMLKTSMKRKEEIRQRAIEELMVTRKPWWRKHINHR
jgi:hypothetical protein